MSRIIWAKLYPKKTRTPYFSTNIEIWHIQFATHIYCKLYIQTYYFLLCIIFGIGKNLEKSVIYGICLPKKIKVNRFFFSNGEWFRRSPLPSKDFFQNLLILAWFDMDFWYTQAAGIIFFFCTILEFLIHPMWHSL